MQIFLSLCIAYAVIGILVSTVLNIDEFFGRRSPYFHKEMPYSFGWIVGGLWLPLLVISVWIQIERILEKSHESQ